MTATGETLLIALLAAFTACAGYVAGRLHQWYVVGVDRDEAYQDGFDTGTRSVFSTAARMIAPRRPIRATAPVVPASSPAAGATADAAHPELASLAAPSQGGRHLVPDELIQAATYRLPPDRVARARIPGAPEPTGDAPAALVEKGSKADASDAEGQATIRLAPSIPRPRSS